MNGMTTVQWFCDPGTFYDFSFPVGRRRPKDRQTGSTDYCSYPPCGEWRKPSGEAGLQGRRKKVVFRYSLARERLEAKLRPCRFFALPSEVPRALNRHYSKRDLQRPPAFDRCRGQNKSSIATRRWLRSKSLAIRLSRKVAFLHPLLAAPDLRIQTDPQRSLHRAWRF